MRGEETIRSYTPITLSRAILTRHQGFLVSGVWPFQYTGFPGSRHIHTQVIERSKASELMDLSGATATCVFLCDIPVEDSAANKWAT